MGSARAELGAVFEPIVGARNIRLAGPEDAVDGWQPALIIAPASADEAAAVLRRAGKEGLHVLPRGGGTKRRWGNVPQAGEIILSTERLNQLVEHAYGDMTATVEAGMPLGTLQRRLAEHGQMLAIDPPWSEHATLGGIIATDSSGPLRIRYGTMRDLLIGIEVALPDGTVAHGGGKVVKNVAGYDVMKLFTGALGSLGLITSATIRLHPMPAAIASVYVDVPDASAAQAFVLDLNASTLTPSGVQIVAGEGGYGIYVRFSGVEASVVAQAKSLVARAHAAGRSSRSLDDEESHRAWHAHATIFMQAEHAAVARFSILPGSIAATLDMLAQVADRLRLTMTAVVQATGTGLVRFAGENEQATIAGVGSARARIVEQGGNLVALLFPSASKQHFDVWGPVGDALPLIQRIKAQFDPHGIMNPGRYVERM